MPRKSPNAIDIHVGKRVKMRRMTLSMSQQKLGDALGLTFQQVQKYEKGTNRIGASRLQQIAIAMQCAPAFFFEGLPAGNAITGQVDFDGFLTTTDGITIATNFTKIKDAKMRRHLATLIELAAAA